MKTWCAYVLRSLYAQGRRLRILLIDETDILKNYRVLVVAVPFRKRAIPIYWKIYAKDAFDKMVYPSHNTLIQEFCVAFLKVYTETLPNVVKPVLVFDRGFARTKYLMEPFIEAGIDFVIRVCKHTCIYHKGVRKKLQSIQETGSYPDIRYHNTLKLPLNLQVFKNPPHKEPLYLVSNCLRNLSIYHTYKHRMQIEEGFRNIKTLFGFRHFRLKCQELPCIELLWLIACVSYGICFLHFEKSGERWMQNYNTLSMKTYSLISVIKWVLETACEPDTFLKPLKQTT